jgi:hypothetical protein
VDSASARCSCSDEQFCPVRVLRYVECSLALQLGARKVATGGGHCMSQCLSGGEWLDCWLLMLLMTGWGIEAVCSSGKLPVARPSSRPQRVRAGVA